MPLDSSAIDAAIREIETAFAGLEPPGDDRLLHPKSMDDMDIVDFYGEPDNQSLSDATIIGSYAAPSFFSAEAFQYYMPAFMIWSLRHYDTIEYAPESTVMAFDPGPEGYELRPFQISKFALFTDAQRAAVVRFLETMLPDADLGPVAEGALRNYWREHGARGATG